MAPKNYYRILELPPSATPEDIKKAFRRLAVRHHPDKNPEDAGAGARFREIQEAYAVLSHPAQRSRYDQRRWYRGHTAPAERPEKITAELLYRKTLRLQLYVERLEAAFVNREALYHYILKYLLEPAPVAVLDQEDAAGLAERIIASLLPVLRLLPYEQAQKVCTRLLLLRHLPAESKAAVTRFQAERRRTQYWEKYRFACILLLTALICWLAYRSGR